jgi:cytidylate kinase
VDKDEDEARGRRRAHGLKNTEDLMAILTVSSQHGSKGTAIARDIAREVGYEYIDKERVLKDIRVKRQGWEKWEEEFDEHSPTIWERNDWSFRGFVALQQSFTFEYALTDNVVIVSKGANFLLKDIPYVLKARFEAPFEERVGVVENREETDRGMARWMVEKLDKESKGFISSVYNEDWNLHTHYDVIFNTTVQTADIIIASLKTALLEKDKLKTEDAIETLRMKAAAKKVKAGILTNQKFFVPTLDVFPSGGAIVLRGIIHTPKEHKNIEDEARHLAGDIPIKCELHYR